MLTDPIADMLTRIRNSMRIKSDKVDIPISKMKTGNSENHERRRVHKSIQNIEGQETGVLRVIPKYVDNQSIITD